MLVPNEKCELVAMRSVSGWRVCMDYWKFNAWIEKISFQCRLWTKFLIALWGIDGIAFRMVIQYTT